MAREGAAGAVEEAAIAVLYGPATEPWGVRRFSVRDPLGRLLNILSHDTPTG